MFAMLLISFESATQNKLHAFMLLQVRVKEIRRKKNNNNEYDEQQQQQKEVNFES